MAPNAKMIIGDDLREAIDWLQDRLDTSRPIAENAMFALMNTGSIITTDGGVRLTEDEEEITRQAKRLPMKKMNRIHFRNNNRSRGKVKITGINTSSAAKDMIDASSKRNEEE